MACPACPLYMRSARDRRQQADRHELGGDQHEHAKRHRKDAHPMPLTARKRTACIQ